MSLLQKIQEIHSQVDNHLMKFEKSQNTKALQNQIQKCFKEIRQLLKNSKNAEEIDDLTRLMIEKEETTKYVLEMKKGISTKELRQAHIKKLCEQIEKINKKVGDFQKNVTSQNKQNNKRKKNNYEKNIEFLKYHVEKLEVVRSNLEQGKLYSTENMNALLDYLTDIFVSHEDTIFQEDIEKCYETIMVLADVKESDISVLNIKKEIKNQMKAKKTGKKESRNKQKQQKIEEKESSEKQPSLDKKEVVHHSLEKQIKIDKKQESREAKITRMKEKEVIQQKSKTREKQRKHKERQFKNPKSEQHDDQFPHISGTNIKQLPSEQEWLDEAKDTPQHEKKGPTVFEQKLKELKETSKGQALKLTKLHDEEVKVSKRPTQQEEIVYKNKGYSQQVKYMLEEQFTKAEAKAVRKCFLSIPRHLRGEKKSLESIPSTLKKNIKNTPNNMKSSQKKNQNASKKPEVHYAHDSLKKQNISKQQEDFLNQMASSFRNIPKWNDYIPLREKQCEDSNGNNQDKSTEKAQDKLPNKKSNKIFPTYKMVDLSTIAKMKDETLFLIFYSMKGKVEQYFAAKELKNRHWRYNTKYLNWFRRYGEPSVEMPDYEIATYVFFDYVKFSNRKRTEFTMKFHQLEDKI